MDARMARIFGTEKTELLRIPLANSVNPTYNKLIRDRIPEIIAAASDRRYETRQLTDAEYASALDQKLGEELQEYLSSGDVAELADLVEVVHAIVQHKGLALDTFEQLRQQKHQERGGFTQRLLLIRTDD